MRDEIGTRYRMDKSLDPKELAEIPVPFRSFLSSLHVGEIYNCNSLYAAYVTAHMQAHELPPAECKAIIHGIMNYAESNGIVTKL